MQFLRTYRLPLMLGLAAVFTAAIWYAVFYFEDSRSVAVTFFDVGQGDAIFIELPDRNQILIDGGPGKTILSKLGRAMPFWDRSIDLLVLTHPHADHLDGLLEVLGRYRVGMVLESGVSHSIPEYQEWRTVLNEKNIPVVFARAGHIVRAGSGISLRTLAPFDNESGKTKKNMHDANVVLRMVHGKNSFLFTGDAEKMEEYRMILEHASELDTDVLKVGHHGSKTSSTEEFLRAVSPRFAVIQVGKKNRYGHPAQEVIDRLITSGAKIFRNDLDGDIRFSSDGNSLEEGRSK